MRIEDREEFVDQVAQAVIDKMEERDRIESMVSLVAARVVALQKEQKEAALVLAETSHANRTAENLSDTFEENIHVEHP